ncbi:phage head closure protein [Azohydromonas aeria]|uniref:phage head closure protein n=1 Tax=Azohydromonas aeria TaxID=2590212 RepID=UPI0012FCB536|nr:phage head closure protein [Azohydromonas aeria]
MGADFDTRVALQRHSGAKDKFGQPLKDAWADVAQVWANRKLGVGVEQVKAGADMATVRASFRIRWRAGVDSGMRLVEVGSGAVWDIQAVLADRRENRIDLACEQINPRT